MTTPENDGFVRTFARGLRVIEAMGDFPVRSNIAQISETSELPRTVVRRLLMTLIELGFVQVEEGSYWLTPSVLKLGMAYLYTFPFWRSVPASAVAYLPIRFPWVASAGRRVYRAGRS
ncbi:helix-turn-helix domain-containing protein [Advenella kashmirensis]